MNNLQLMKAMGHLANCPIKDLDKLSISIKLPKRKCCHPDFPDQEIADCPDHQKLARQLNCTQHQSQNLILSHRRMLQATGQGSWPVGCNPDYPEHHTVKVFVDYDSFADHYHRKVTAAELDNILEAKVWGLTKEKLFDVCLNESLIKTAVRFADETYRRVSCLHVPATEDYNIHVKPARLRGNTVGMAWFNNGTCGDQVDHHLDKNYDPPLRTLAQLIAHEYGHNHNRDHTFRNEREHHGIMSYNDPHLFFGYSTGQSPHSLPRDPSLNGLIRQYGDKILPAIDPLFKVLDPEDPIIVPTHLTVRVPRLPYTLELVSDDSPDDIIW